MKSLLKLSAIGTAVLGLAASACTQGSNGCDSGPTSTNTAPTAPSIKCGPGTVLVGDTCQIKN